MIRPPLRQRRSEWFIANRRDLTAPGYLPSLCLTEISPPDHFPQVFYRHDAVDTRLRVTPPDLDYIGNARMFITNGTSLCASPSRESICRSLERARQAGCRVVFDVDYRAMSWESPEEAGLAVRLILPYVDVLIGNQLELQLVAGKSSVEEAVFRLRHAGVPMLVSKLGEQGTRVFNGDETVFLPPYHVEVVSTIGAGDGFASGFLYAHGKGLAVSDCLHYGNAAAAIVVSRLSCSEAMPTLTELEQMVRGKRSFMFDSKKFLTRSAIARLTDIRVSDPLFSRAAADARLRRQIVAPDGRLNILAADHPARRVTKAGDDPLAMADRHDYLSRVVRVLTGDLVDGVMATMDILEDLLTINELVRRAGGTPPADGKLLIGSLNRRRFGRRLLGNGRSHHRTEPRHLRAAWNLDGTRLLMRVCDESPGSLNTIVASARAITEANAASLPTFLEPLPVVRTEKGYTVVKTADALARLVGVASALGDSSHRLWLKLPCCENYARVTSATTLPILLLGGETQDPVPFLRQVSDGLASGANVRGALAGRNVLYPGLGDPLAVAEAAGGIIHQAWTVDQAVEHLNNNRDRATPALL